MSRCHAIHLVSAFEEHRIRRLFHERNIAISVPEIMLEELIPGRPLVSGMFLVQEGTEEFRLIFDRRPANSGERRLNWLDLPLGVMFTRLILSPAEGLGSSGDDLHSMFNALAEHVSGYPRQGVRQTLWRR